MKHLLPPVKRYFKAHLHTHTTISDGSYTPDEIKDIYKSRGYQIMSYTDHNVIVSHQALDDEDFLTLTGVEYNITQEGSTSLYQKTCHLNFISKDPNNLVQPYPVTSTNPQRTQLLEKVRFDQMTKAYDPEALNALIAWGNANGFLVMYNHPTWSLENYTDYAPLKGLWGMEICNFASTALGQDEHNAWVYRDMLRLSNRLFPVGTDDVHKARDLTGAWIMVGAEKLEYGAVIQALENGDFYASTGPEIHSLTLDGKKLRITCSDARQIDLDSDCRFSARAVPQGSDPLLREAEIDISRWMDASIANSVQNAYIRLTVRGPYGHTAYTRAYWLDELK